ncbi:MAG: geranylgeranylglycerol-phosphate geranylgeranyltransferase [Odoribacter sp.]|nr:geranylgeranylglycerol-phosphate geranylgeranyltransferase [Odoribacter sp.]
MQEILRLIRIRTIAFAALTMYAMRYWVILPILELNGFTLQMTNWAFSLLVFAVCCLISGAYMINDYFDIRTDRISGIRNVVVGKSLSRRSVIVLHSLLNACAVIIAFYLGFAVKVWKIGILFLLVSGILWFYSSYYKKYFITGNIIAGLLTALIPVSAIIYEIPLLNMAYAGILLETGTNFLYMFNWMFAFSWFIFLNTLMYEINKDIYTVEGDKENGYQTIPVVLGISATRNIIAGLAVVAMLSAGVFYWVEFTASRAIFAYLLIAIWLPYAAYIVIVRKKDGNRRLQLRLIRIMMLLCIGVSLFFKHFFQLIFAN